MLPLAALNPEHRYALFWGVSLGIKILFDYMFIVKPLVEPTRKLWEVDMYCWHYDQLYSNCRLDVVDFVNSDNNILLTTFAPKNLFDDGTGSYGYVHVVRWLRMRFFNVMLIALRWATPIVIMLADTILAYTLVGAIGSGFLGLYYRIAEIVEWSDMVRRFRGPSRDLPCSQTTSLILAQSPPIASLISADLAFPHVRLIASDCF